MHADQTVTRILLIHRDCLHGPHMAPREWHHPLADDTGGCSHRAITPAHSQRAAAGVAAFCNFCALLRAGGSHGPDLVLSRNPHSRWPVTSMLGSKNRPPPPDCLVRLRAGGASSLPETGLQCGSRRRGF